MSKRPSSDVAIAVLHAIVGAALLASLATGMRIAADEPSALLSPWLAGLAPRADVFGWHVLAGYALCAAAAGYWAYLRLTGLDRRLTLPGRLPARGNARARLFRVNVRIWWVLYGLLGLLGASGAALLLDTDLGSGLVMAWAVEVHGLAAWALMGAVAAHVAAQYAFGGAAATTRGAARLRSGLDWLLKMVRARVTPAAIGLTAERDLRSLVGWDGWRPRQLGMCCWGCFCFALGVKCFIDADLGVDPLHAMTIGIVRAIDAPYLKIGFVDGAVTAGLLAAWVAWTRRPPPLSTFAAMTAVGLMVDFWNVVGLERWTEAALPRPLLMLLGLLLDAYGSALIIMSGVGVRVMDLLALAAVERLGWRFRTGRLLLEGGFLLAGWLLGGPVGVATVAFVVVVVVPFIEPFMRISRRHLGLPNYGLPRRPAAGAG